MNKTTKEINKAIRLIGTITKPRDIPAFNIAISALKFAKWIMKHPDFELINSYYLKVKFKELIKK